MLSPAASIGTVVIFTILWVDFLRIVEARNDAERLRPINTPLSELRDFRGIKLANGLQALLISDFGAQKSAAAMVVAVGSVNDEKERPGIANLVRYLLLRSCQKYRKKNEFEEYVKQRGGKLGSQHITSDAEHKHYFSFEVNPEFIEPTLRRFAEHFIEPLFEGVDGATLNEVLGKSRKKHDQVMSTDKMRIAQLLKSISEKDHSYYNLTYGTVKMLNKYAGVEDQPVDEILMNFVRKWYSAGLMRVVVLGNESLDVLEDIVTKSFIGIKIEGEKKLTFSYDQHPWKSDQLKHRICIAPVKNSVREIRLSFPAPDVLEEYKISPEKYVIQFLNHRGPGTLGYVLPNRGLCEPNPVRAEYQTHAGIGFFTIIIELTEEGLHEVDRVLELTFRYIDLLKNEGVQYWFYEEEKRLSKFNFKLSGENLDVVQHLASAMHDYPIEDVLSFKYIRGSWNAEHIHKFLSYLRPDNVNVSIIDKSCDGGANIRTEPWYGTKYQIERISDETINNWTSLSHFYPELHVPPRNEFIADHLFLDTTNVDENMPRHPQVIHSSSLARIWYKRCDEAPLVQTLLHVMSPIMHSKLLNGIFMEVFLRMVDNSLDEYVYSASRTACVWNTTITRFGFQIKLLGTSSKVAVLLEKILSRFFDFENVLTEENFEKAKNETFDGLKELQQSSSTMSADLATFYIAYIFSSGGWGLEPIIALQNEFQFHKIKKFCAKLLSRIHIQGLIYGNCDKQKAIGLANAVKRLFRKTSRRMLPQEMLNLWERPVQFEYGRNFVYHIFSSSPTHYYHASFQIGSEDASPENIRRHTIARLFHEIVIESCTKILPPRETGSSECRIDSVKDIRSFMIVIKSRIHPRLLDMRAEKFLELMRDKLRDMSDARFRNHKMNFMMNKIANSEDGFQRSKFYWEEILHRTYTFRRITMELEQLQTNLEKEDVIAFFDETLAKHASKRRKLAVYVYSKKLLQNTPEDIPTGATYLTELQSTKIEDIVAFKVSSSLLPMNMPIMKK